MDEPPTLGLLRSDDLWFNDGNIVLRAENTVYRVHIGMLAGNSSVFRTMFALPQPAGNDAETYDGCPLVLMPDSAYDMDQFLKALCLHSVDAQIASDFSAFAAILRLSTKYEVAPLRQRAISVLAALYSTSLVEFKQRHLTETRLPSWDIGNSRPVAVLVLAQECQIPSVVPAALYCLSQQPSECIFDELVLPSTSHSGLRFRLSPAQQRMVVVGRDRLSKAVRNGPLSFLTAYAATPPCGADACQNAFKEEIQDYWERASDPYCNLAFGDFPGEDLGLDPPCAICLTSAREEHQRSQEELWDRLPGIFGLDSWEVLRAETL